MFLRIRQFLSPPIFEDEDKTRVARLLYVVLIVFVMATAAIIVFSFVTEGLPTNFREAFIPIISVGLIALNAGLYVIARRGRLVLASSILLSVLWAIITFWIYAFSGLAGDGSMVIYPLIIVLAGMLLGGRATLIFTWISVFAGVGVFYIEESGFIDYPDDPALLGELVITVMVFILIGLLLRSAVRNLTDAIARARQNSRAQIKANRELEAIRASLEERVAERTSELERRARYLGLSAQVARDAAAVIDNPQALLGQVVSLISEQLGYYHIALFMLNATGEQATLTAASSDGGQRMLGRGYQVQIDQDGGIISDVVQQGEPRIVLDVNLDVEFSYEPELLDTRSQIVLPLQARSQIIGVLDVQSTDPAAFSDQDVTVLRTLADQVAMAISNARLFQQSQEALEAERQAYGQMTQETWRKMLREQANQGVIRNDRGLAPVGNLWRPQMRTALKTGEMIRDQASVGIPIVVRGRVIGVIDAKKPDGAMWAEDEIEMISNLAEQLNVALDSAQLYQETQRRESEQRLIGEVTAEMRRTLDVESMLQTAIREIGDALNLARVEVRMGQIEPQGGEEVQ